MKENVCEPYICKWILRCTVGNVTAIIVGRLPLHNMREF